jgi:D-xylose transport system substrate-binding protein
MDVLKDIKPLAEKAVEVAVSFLKGEEVKYDTKIFNGKIDVKTSLIPVKVVNKNNLEEIIIKSGFHSKEDLLK